jgi:hypothetical protein
MAPAFCGGVVFLFDYNPQLIPSERYGDTSDFLSMVDAVQIATDQKFTYSYTNVVLENIFKQALTSLS